MELNQYVMHLKNVGLIEKNVNKDLMHYDNIENNGMKRTRCLKINHYMIGVHTQQIVLDMDVLVNH